MIVVLIILLFNAIFIFSSLKKRAYFEAYARENLEEAFKRQFPYAEFETIVQKEEGRMVAVQGYETGGNGGCCAIYTKELFFDRWYYQRGVALNKVMNPSTCVEIPSYGKVYLSWNSYGIRRIVVVKGGEQMETEMASDEFILLLTDDDTNEVHFFIDGERGIFPDVLFPL